MLSVRLYPALLFFVLLTACRPAVRPKRFEALPATATGIDFVNQVGENDRYNFIDYSYLYNGGGVAICDVNNDSLPDVYFTGNQVSSRLYLNLGNFRFKEATAPAGLATEGWCTGATWADVNADGLPDLYVSRAGNEPAERRRNLLFIHQGIQNGVPTFIEQAQQYGLADDGYSTQGLFFDFDRDGDLDLYVLNATNDDRHPSRIRPLQLDGSSPANDHFYRNDGRGHFTECARQVGIMDDGWGLGIGAGDFDNDGWLDLYVANDFLADDIIYLNDRRGKFLRQTKESVGHTSHFSMGNCVADLNNDGWPEVLVADMLPTTNAQRKKMAGPHTNEAFAMTVQSGYLPHYMRNTLQLNRGSLRPVVAGGRAEFAEVAQLAGVQASDWSWSPLAADFDHDGRLDFFVSNGYFRDITDLDFVAYNNTLGQQLELKTADERIKELAKKLPGYHTANRFYHNRGDLTFADSTRAWSDSVPSYANGAAYADLDLDGDLDLVVNNLNEPATIYRNNGPVNSYLKVTLIGQGQNRWGIGAKVEVYTKGQAQMRYQLPVTGYQSSGEPVLHFGLAGHAQADSVVVVWPDQTSQTLRGVPARQTLVLHQAKASGPRPSNIAPPPWFTDLAPALGIHFAPPETMSNDLAAEPLKLARHTDNSPCMAVGDLNGDGRDDVLLGGAYQQAAQLFFQLPSGKFRQQEMAPAKPQEDGACALFDADGDGDLDIWVASGSNEGYNLIEDYRPRLYTNDGRGNFALVPAALPPAATGSSTSIAVADYDRDGDLDVFMGGRLVPQRFPQAGRSYLFRNDSRPGRPQFTDATPAALQPLGMITSAIWADVNRDQWPDLVVAGEGMPITVISNQRGQFRPEFPPLPLAGTQGQWLTLATADFDHDGDPDLVAGNWGQNHSLGIGPGTPLQFRAADIDQNGSLDLMLTYHLNGTAYPFATRDELLRQLPILRKKYLNYADFARLTARDLPLRRAKEADFALEIRESANLYIENLGGGRWQTSPLPKLAQITCFNAFLVDDYNGDGHADLLAAGNSQAPDVKIGQLDAAGLTLLLGDGRGHFEVKGLSPNPQVHKALGKVVINGQNTVWVAGPNWPIKVLRLAGPSEKLAKLPPKSK